LSDAVIKELRSRLTLDEYRGRRPFLWLGQGFSRLLGYKPELSLAAPFTNFLRNSGVQVNHSAEFLNLFNIHLKNNSESVLSFLDLSFSHESLLPQWVETIFSQNWHGILLDCFEKVVDDCFEEYHLVHTAKDLEKDPLFPSDSVIFRLRPDFANINSSPHWLYPFPFTASERNRGLLKLMLNIINNHGLVFIGTGIDDQRFVYLLKNLLQFRSVYSSLTPKLLVYSPKKDDLLTQERSSLSAFGFEVFQSSTKSNLEKMEAFAEALKSDFSSSITNIDLDYFLLDRIGEAKQRPTEAKPIDLKQFIRAIEVKQFKCISQLRLSLPIAEKSQWVLITGENGVGKTSFLQALAGPQYHENELENLFENAQQEPLLYIEADKNHGKHDIHQACKWNGKRWERPSKQTTERIDIVGYGPMRMFRLPENNSDDEQIQKNAVESLFQQHGLLLNIEHWLKMRTLDLQQAGSDDGKAKLQERIDAVLALLTKLMPKVERIQIKGSNIAFTCEGKEIRSFLLSSGQKNVLGMIGDLIIRMYDYHPDVVNPEDFTGVVLIDEIENHLHPSWQVRFPKLLSEVFPKIQFWATTHSALPFLGVPPNSNFIRLEMDEKEGVKAELLNLPIENLLPNTILTSPIFDMDQIVHQYNEDFGALATDDYYGATEKREQLLKDLREADTSALKRFLDEEDF
jgi:energy-coupling factor transporter ATP-binding protein EcfA2